jgi:hypothetical protein
MHQPYQLMEAYNSVYSNEDVISEEETLDIEDWLTQLVQEGYDLDEYSDEELLESYYGSLDEELTGSRASRAAKMEGEYRRKGKDRSVLHNLLRPSDDQTSFGRGNKSRKRRGLAPAPRNDASGNYYSEEVDLYDIISEYLVSEGFCESYEDADVIMANMSEEWRESILESRGDGDSNRFKHKITRNVKKQKGTKTSYDNLGNMVRQPYHAQLKKRKLPPYNY